MCTDDVRKRRHRPRSDGQTPSAAKGDPAMRSFRSILAVSATSVVALAAASPASAAVQMDRGAPATEKNIVETAVAAGQFKTLASLLGQAGLVETPAGKSRVTVFAPTHAAVPQGPQAPLHAPAEDKGQPRARLLFHLADRKLN